MKKRLVSVFICVAVGMTMLAACGSDDSSDVSAAAEESAAAETTEETTEEESTDTEDSDSDWDGETETDKMHYTEVEEELGEITADMVPEDFSIGVVSMEASNTYWVDLNEGIEERCEELGIDVDVEYVVGSTNYEDTLANAETMYSMGYSAYIFSPENETCLEEITEQITSEGIPVINAYCCQISTATCLIGSMDSETAIESAMMALEEVGENGTVAVAMGDLGSKLAQTRTNYFIDYLEENSNITVEEIPAQWDPSTARTMTTDLLTANSDVAYIWCNNDDLGIGVYEGVREAGMTDSVKVISMDGTTAAFSSIEDGELYGTFANYPKLIGRLSVDAAVRAALGQDLPRVIETDVEFVTAENLDEYLEEQ